MQFTVPPSCSWFVVTPLHGGALPRFCVPSRLNWAVCVQVPDPAFSLGVAARRRGRTGYELEVCTSYLRGSGQVARTILDVEMPSGYIPVDSTLRNLRRGTG